MKRYLVRGFKMLGAAFVIAVLILATTNPGPKSFKDFGNDDVGNEQRLSNYLLFSVYQREEYDGHYVRYLGVLLNFYQMDN